MIYTTPSFPTRELDARLLDPHAWLILAGTSPVDPGQPVEVFLGLREEADARVAALRTDRVLPSGWTVWVADNLPVTEPDD